jgi:hypothetical protein
MRFEYKTVKEIVEEIVNALKFDIVATEHNFGISFSNSINFLNDKELLSSLETASLLGSKTLGFVNKVPHFKLKRLINGVCIVISTEVSDTINLPTIFCKSADDFGNLLYTAYELSVETRLMVNLVVSKKLFHSFTKISNFLVDNERNHQKLNKNLLQNTPSETIGERLILAEGILNAKIPNKIDSSTFSFTYQGGFLNYIVPGILPKIENSKFSVYKDEFSMLLPLINLLDLKVNFIEHEKDPFEAFYTICPGCPFLCIFTQLPVKDKIVFSDIKCPSIKTIFSVEYATLSEIYGMAISTSEDIVYITNYSSFNSKFIRKNISFILLQDIDADIEYLKKIKEPFKIKSGNIIFPYSCENIVKYRPPKFNLKKCNCLINNKVPDCIEKTHCAAIKRDLKNIALDLHICTGCLACTLVCKERALR